MTRAATKRKPGLRAALAAKKSRVSHFDVPVAASDVVDRISARVKKHAESLEFAKLAGNDEMAKREEKALASARAELDGCFYRVDFIGLPFADFDALVNEYPPTDDQAAKGQSWNDEFIYALIEASTVDGDSMTAEDWKEELNSKRWTRADRTAFFSAVYDANTQQFSEGVPKD